MVLASVVFCLILVGIMRAGERLVFVPLGINGLYECVHAIANACVSVYAARDALTTLRAPAMAESVECDWRPMPIVVAIHLYHVLFFNMTYEDCLHHIVMLGVCIPAWLTYDTGALCNLCAFSLCGAPGCLSYTLIALRKNGILSRTTAKRLCAATYSWMRTPLITCTSYCILVSGSEHESFFSQKASIRRIVSLVVFWNGQYYGRQVVENYGAHLGRLTNHPRTPPPSVC